MGFFLVFFSCRSNIYYHFSEDRIDLLFWHPGSSSTGSGKNKPSTYQTGGTNEEREIGESLAKYESGNLSVKAITSVQAAAEDKGGWSYGKYQIATNTGTMNQYLKTSKYKEEFEGLKPGTKAFNHKWLEIADRDPKGFGRINMSSSKESIIYPR